MEPKYCEVCGKKAHEDIHEGEHYFCSWYCRNLWVEEGC